MILPDRQLPDRLKLLLDENQDAVTGIDYVRVGPGHKTLTVFFHKDPKTLADSLENDLTTEAVSIGEIPVANAEMSATPDETSVGIDSLTWQAIGGKQALVLHLNQPGGFMPYRLTIHDARLDPYYNSIVFSFKASCPTDLDCQAGDPHCISQDTVDFAVDYGARDYDSFRRALLDFASQRYPRWQDRIAADMGILMAEVFSALGDEMAYYQDQVRRQAYLETASERRSLRRHARLVDTEISDGNSATTWLDITVQDGQEGSIPAGADVWAESDRGRMIHYEIGNGLAEALEGVAYKVSHQLNCLIPHIWDEDDACLLRGANRLDIQGAYKTHLINSFFSADAQDQPGRWLVLQTTPGDPAKTPRRHLIWIDRDSLEEITDPLIKTEDTEPTDPLIEIEDAQPLVITRIIWQESNALPVDMDLTELEIRGNIVPVTAGKTYPDTNEVSHARFVVGKDPDDPDLGLPADQQTTLERAIEREGAAGHPVYLYSLPLSESTPVTWLTGMDEIATPEVVLKQVAWDGSSWQEVEDWTVVRSFTGPPGSSKPTSRHVILDDGTWRRVVGYRLIGNTIIHRDYAANEGKTVRFGSGDLGRIPAAGSIFEVTYRLGNGLATQVAADTLTNFDTDILDFVTAVTNPFAAENAQDPDPPTRIRLTAPEAFQQLTFRAVRPEDYAEAGERLDWVQKAACPFRWTGSWSSGLATAEPYDAVTLSNERRQILTDHLERFRLAGHHITVVTPRYADLDLEIKICAQPSAYRGEVKAAVLSRLLDEGGFFDPDQFSFGDPLYRAQLEAAIQSVSGVLAVDTIQIKRLGYFDWRPFDEAYYEIALDEIVRIENDPRYPTRGSVKLILRGGA